MLNTQTINNDCVAVSYSPSNIFLRKHGKKNYNDERQLIRIVDGNVVINKKVASDFNLGIQIMED